MRKVITLLLSVLLIVAFTMQVSAISTVAVKGIKLDKTSISLKVGQTYGLMATLIPSNTTQKSLTYVSSDKKTATITSSGKITGVSAGTATITVYTLNKKIYAKCKVTISKAVPPIDISKKVTLTGYLVADEPAGEPAVLDALNKELLKDINATLDVKFIGWGDFWTKYPLVLASGEPMDFAFAANWAAYADNAAKGAFREVTMSEIQKYMPLTYAAVPKDGWKDCLVNGKIYMIPQSFKEQLTYGILYRGDLCKKYGLNELKKVTDLGPYFEQVQKNNPSMIPFNLGTADTNLLAYYTTEDCGYGDLYSVANTNLLAFNLDDSTYKTLTPFEEPYFSSIKKGAAWIRSLYDKGYLPKNPYSNSVTSSDSLLNGTSACAMSGSDSAGTVIATARAKGMDLEFFPVLTPKGTTTVRAQNGNGIAIPATAQNPERSMMAWDLIMQNKDYNYLVSFGVKGTNWVEKNGKIALPDGVTADKNTYPLYGGGFFMTNRDEWEPQTTDDPYYLQYKAALKKISQPNPLNGFNPVTDSIKTEMADLANVYTQYRLPLSYGTVKDVNSGINTWKQKAEAAGLGNVTTELSKQVKAYIASLK